MFPGCGPAATVVVWGRLCRSVWATSLAACRLPRSVSVSLGLLLVTVAAVAVARPGMLAGVPRRERRFLLPGLWPPLWQQQRASCTSTGQVWRGGLCAWKILVVGRKDRDPEAS